MNITVDKQPNCTATLKVEVPSEAVRTERDRIVSTYASQARIQGFRPGKAPRNVVEKRFAPQISEELEQRLGRKAFDEALRKENLKVLDFGQPTGFNETPDGSMTFESRLTLAPDVDLPDYKGITLQSPAPELTDAELEQQIDGIRERFAEYQDITDRAAEAGDLAVLDYSSTLDGKPLEEAIEKSAGYLAGREGFWMKIDEQSFLPGFAMELVGTKPGDEKTITVTVPEDFPLAELHGKELVFAVSVKELKTQQLPELDDDFAAKLGAGSMDDLRENIRQRAEYEKRRQIDDMKVNQIVEYFSSQVDFELPDDLLREETQSQADQLVKRGVQSGMNEDEIAAQQQEIFVTAGVQARTNLKTNFILQEIARLEGIEVNDQELVQHLARIAQSQKQNAKKFIKDMQRQGRIPGIRNSMLVGKAIDFILEHAKVEETSAPAEESTPES